MISDDLWHSFNQPLYGKNIVLEPLHPDHYNELNLIAGNPEIWTYMLHPEFEKWFGIALKEKQQKQRCSYVVRQQKNQQVVGSLSFLDVNETHRSCTLGRIWYCTSVWGTEVNPDCMLTLLTHSFEKLDFNRIELRTDLHNIHSQRFIEKLGATREGVLRQHFITEDNQSHDVVYYSILQSEWPQVKEGLKRRLSSKDMSDSLCQPYGAFLNHLHIAKDKDNTPNPWNTLTK